MANLAASDVTITLNTRDRHVLGGLRLSQGSLAFGDGSATYPNGGVPMPAIGSFGMNKEVSMFDIVDASGDGLIYRYDQANRKIKIFTPAPPIVHEEVVTVTSKVGYLKWPAAHIEYVTDDANDYRVIPGGLTPATGQVAVDMGFNVSTGVLTRNQRCSLTFYDTVSGGTVKVSYITQAWKEVADNMVQACMTSGARTYGHANLSFTIGTPDVIKLGEDFIALQSVCWNNGGTITPMSPLRAGVTPTSANGECAVDFRKATSFGELYFDPTDAVDTTADVVYFNYIRDPGAGSFLYDRFVNSDVDDSSDTLTFSYNPLIYCTCGGLPMETSTKKALFTSKADTLAAGEVQWTSHPFAPGTTIAIAPIATMHGSTDDDTTPALIVGHPSEIHTVPLEMPQGKLIQATTLRFMAWGR
jgi:hypothetical protein